MRNPDRIPIILAQIKKFWEKNPDLRFTQLAQALVKDPEEFRGDFYYLEDEELFDNIKPL